MVKKSGKGKEKKLERKEAAERAAALAEKLRQLVDSSACGEELAAQYPAFHRYDRRGLASQLRFYSAAELPPGLLNWALMLTRSHMAALYEACPDWGWSDAKKRAELAHVAARYLVVFQQEQQGQQQQRAEEQQAAEAPAGGEVGAAAAAATSAPGGQENSAAAGNGGDQAEQQQQQQQQQQGQPVGQPVAFLHYRFEEEEGQAVLYCYEIQVAQTVQGKGLGKFLMQLLEFIGRRSGVARLMLTVFHANEAAIALYRKLGFVLDADSPGTVDPAGDHKYEIMTKWLQQPQQQ